MASTPPDPLKPEDSNAKLIPPSATVSSTLPTRRFPQERFLESASTGVRRIGSMIGLPGVSEMGGMIRDLAQSPNDCRVELASLNAYTKNMLMIASSNYSSLQDMLAESTSQMEAARQRIEDLENDTRYMNADRARRKQEEVEQLSREVTRLADIQTNIRLRMHNVTAQVIQLGTNARLGTPAEIEEEEIPEDKLPLVDLDMILNQEPEQSYTAVDRKYRFKMDTCKQICIAEYEARVTCSTGFLNGVRVLRKSYNSADKTIATRFARKDLVSLTKHIHQNVARLKGVTRDIHDQICGFVTTTAPLTHEVFLQRVTDPVSLACFMKGHLELCILQEMGGWMSRWMKGGVQLQVDYNGHVTAVPAEGRLESVDLLSMVVSYHSRSAVNSLVKDILKIYWHQVLFWNDSLNQPRLRDFIDRVPHLGLNRTLLDVLKIAADTGIGPSISVNVYKSNEPPSVTFSGGEIGVMKDKQFVKMLGKPPWTAERVKVFDLWRPSEICLQTEGWRSLALDPNTTIQSWYEKAAPQTWESIRTRAKQLAKFHNTALSGLGYANPLHVFLNIRHTKNMHKIGEEVTLPSDAANAYCDEHNCSLKSSNRPYPLYFHRRLTSRDCPREYWGFFSTSPDPHEQCPEFPIGTDRVEYLVDYFFYKMDQDYRIRYDKMVEDGLKTMPGSFGG